MFSRFFLASLCLFLGSCTLYHRQWRTNYDVTPLPGLITADDGQAAQARKDRALEVYQDGTVLAHVEFTDQGGIWGNIPPEGTRLPPPANQLDVLEQWVAGDMKKNPSKYRKGAIILTFTHGWHNNALEGNDNLRHFREAVANVKRDDDLGRPVIGVYLSWRGRMRPALPGVLDAAEYVTTFWGRKEAAERIGYRGMAEALMRLSLLRDRIAKHEGVPERDMNSRIIAVGHSFGAQALFSAISRYFEDELMEIVKGGRPKDYVHRRWDLVILINPAFEAHRYEIINRYQARLNYSGVYSRLPRMMITGSENDFPNRTYFPVGQRLDTRTWAVQKGGYRYVANTAGQLPEFQTHRLAFRGRNRPILEPIGTGWYEGRKTMPEFESIVTDTRSVQPFMVAVTDRELVNGHSGIWEEPFRWFLRNLIQSRERTVQAHKR